MRLISSKLIKLRIIAIYIVIIGLSATVSYFVYQNTNSISNAHHELSSKQLPLLNNISNFEHWLNEHERLLYEHYATENTAKDLPRIKEAQHHIHKYLVELNDALRPDPSIASIFALCRGIFEDADSAVAELQGSTDNKWDNERQFLASITSKGESVRPYIHKIKTRIMRNISDSNENSNLLLKYMTNSVSAFGLSIFLIALLVGYYMVRSVRNRYEKRRLVLFIEKSPNAIASLSWQGQIEFENASWKRNYLHSKGDLFFDELLTRLENFQSLESNFYQWQIHYQDRDLEVSMHKVTSLTQVMVFVEDISDRVEARNKLEYLAFHDPTTGLANAKKLEMDIEKEIYLNPKESLYLFTIGMSRLKLVSSTHGYSVSEALLKALIERLTSDLEQQNQRFKVSQFYQFSGAKFCLLLAMKNSSENLQNLIDDLNAYLEQVMLEPLETLFGNFYLDFQTGFSAYPENGLSASMLIKNANAALNEAQKKNTKEIVLFDKEINELEQCWYQLENDLRSSDFEQEFCLVYQPKIDLQTRKMRSMEALVRWIHPQKGIISPVQFIPIAEESGMIISLGNWIMRKACEQTKYWLSQGFEQLQVAVNVSPTQLLSADFLESVKSCLREFDLSPECLEIEITEEVLVKDQQQCIDVLNAIREFGISIAVDDFGTGYSSLGYLNSFPLSKLKIDRSFVTNIDQDKNNYAIVSAIISLSKNLGVKVIAEGIETQQEQDALIELGCDIGQGYLFDKPLNTKKFSDRYNMFSKISSVQLG